MDNSAYDKAMEYLKNKVSRVTFVFQKIFIKTFVIYEIRPVLTFDKLIYVQLSILEIQANFWCMTFITTKWKQNINVVLNYYLQTLIV